MSVAAAEGALLHVVHDNPVWFAAFRAELRRRGLHCRELLVGGDEDAQDALAHINFAEPPAEGVYFNRTSASAHTRGKAHAMDMGAVVVEWLEAHGRRVLGGSRATALEGSKAKQEAQFRRFGVAVPETHLVFCTGAGGRPREDAVDAALARFAPRQRVVVKPSRGGSGAGVRIFDSPAEAKAHFLGASFDAGESVDGIYLVQQFIDSPEQCLWRMEFVGGKLLYGVRVDTSDVLASPDGVRNCPADSCSAERDARSATAPMSFEVMDVGAATSLPPVRFEPAAPAGGASAGACPFTIDTAKFVVTPEFTDPIVPSIEALLAANEIDVCGVEVVRDASGKAFVIDMNCVNSNYNSKAERKAGLGAPKKKGRASRGRSGPQAVVDLMLAELQRLYGDVRRAAVAEPAGVELEWAEAADGSLSPSPSADRPSAASTTGSDSSDSDDVPPPRSDARAVKRHHPLPAPAPVLVRD